MRIKSFGSCAVVFFLGSAVLSSQRVLADAAAAQSFNPEMAPLDSVAPETVSEPAKTSTATDEPSPFAAKNLMVGLFDLSFYSLYLGSPDVHGYAYIPNFRPKIGLYYSYKSTTVGWLIPLFLPQSEIDRRGPTRETHILLRKHWRSAGMEFYYQSYRGLYADSPLSELSTHWPDRYPQLPNATVVNYGINSYFSLDPKHYNLRAAFDFTDFQSESGGSWLIAPFFNHVELAIGDVFIPGSDSSSPQSAPSFSRLTLNTFGAGFGYGYAWVLGRRFVVGQASAGGGLQLQDLKRETEEISQAAPALILNAKVSAGYNFEKYLVGIRLLGSSLSSKVRDLQVSSNLASAQLFFGGRF